MNSLVKNKVTGTLGIIILNIQHLVRHSITGYHLNGFLHIEYDYIELCCIKRLSLS